MHITDILNEINMSHQRNERNFKQAKGLIGFEIEGHFPFIVDTMDLGDVDEDYSIDDDEFNFMNRRELFDALRHFNWIEDIEEDNSIQVPTGRFGAEVITKPIPLDQNSIPKLFELLDYLTKKLGMRCNRSTGFHINISNESTKNPDFDIVKLFAFLGEKHFLNQWDRTDNRFSVSWEETIYKYEMFFRPEDLSSVPNFIAAANQIMRIHNEKNKHTAFNVEKLKLGYIEFRIAGGIDYNIMKNTIKTSILSFTRALEIASKPNMAQREYYAKISKLIQNIKQRKNADGDNVLENLITKLDLHKKVKAKSFNDLTVYDAENILQAVINKFSSFTSTEIILIRKIYDRFKDEPGFPYNLKVANFEGFLKTLTKR